MKRNIRLQIFAMMFIFCLPVQVVAESINIAEDPVSPVLFWVTFIFALSMVGRMTAAYFKQPGVLGELLMGIIVGNIGYFFGSYLMVVLRDGDVIFSVIRDLLQSGSLQAAIHKSLDNAHYAGLLKSALEQPQGMEYIKVAYILDIFSRYGVIFLLFMTGLESSVQELKATGRASFKVAIIGVTVPVLLGFLALAVLMPGVSFSSNLFIAATLCATSIGITARVLGDSGQLRTPEAKTILGAAMIDDVLGLIVLAIVSGMVTQGHIDWYGMLWIVVWTLVFFAAVLGLGPLFLKVLMVTLSSLDPLERKLIISFIFVMLVSWLATLVHLASIVGAFSAGMVINDRIFDDPYAVNPIKTPGIRALLSPLELLLAPLFFMLIGIQVKLESFFNLSVLGIAVALIIVGVIGKLVSGWGANKKDDRLLVGIGMLPRGEVGLVFASIGRSLHILSDNMFAAIVLMIIVTTCITPPLLTARYRKRLNLKK